MPIQNAIAVMGWSFGGVVSMLAAARSTAFLAVVDQAGGALTWDGNSHMRSALIMAAEKSTTPTLFMVARNDRTTASVTTLADIFKKRLVPHKLVIYEPFVPSQVGRVAPGHVLFSSQASTAPPAPRLASANAWLKSGSQRPFQAHRMAFGLLFRRALAVPPACGSEFGLQRNRLGGVRPLDGTVSR